MTREDRVKRESISVPENTNAARIRTAFSAAVVGDRVHGVRLAAEFRGLAAVVLGPATEHVLLVLPARGRGQAEVLLGQGQFHFNAVGVLVLCHDRFQGSSFIVAAIRAVGMLKEIAGCSGKSAV